MFQTTTVFLLVLSSVVYAVWQVLPRLVRQRIAEFALPHVPGRWRASLARHTLMLASSPGGCSGCGGCSSNGTGAQGAVQGCNAKPVHFYPTE